jgi:hypothetical protein
MSRRRRPSRCSRTRTRSTLGRPPVNPPASLALAAGLCYAIYAVAAARLISTGSRHRDWATTHWGLEEASVLHRGRRRHHVHPQDREPELHRGHRGAAACAARSPRTSWCRRWGGSLPRRYPAPEEMTELSKVLDELGKRVSGWLDGTSHRADDPARRHHQIHPPDRDPRLQPCPQDQRLVLRSQPSAGNDRRRLPRLASTATRATAPTVRPRTGERAPRTRPNVADGP